MDKIISTKELCEALDVSRSWVNTHLRHLGGEEPSVTLTKSRAQLTTVYYSVSKVLNFLNKNAKIESQTEWVLASDIIGSENAKKFVGTRNEIIKEAEALLENEKKSSDEKTGNFFELIKSFDEKGNTKSEEEKKAFELLCENFLEIQHRESLLYEEKKIEVNQRKTKKIYSLYDQFFPEPELNKIMCTYNRSRGWGEWVETEGVINSLEDLQTMKDFKSSEHGISDELIYRWLFDIGAKRVTVFGRKFWLLKQDVPAYDKKEDMLIFRLKKISKIGLEKLQESKSS